MFRLQASRDPLRRSYGGRSAFSQRSERAPFTATSASAASASATVPSPASASASAQSAPVIGYDPSLFIEPPADSRELEELTCVICSCVVRAPLNIPCGDLFCSACLTTAYANRRCCPSCKAPFQLSECHVNNHLVKKVWACKVKCPKHAQGCKAEFVIGVKDRNVLAHLAKCEYVDESCEYCGEVMPKHRLDAHINESIGQHMRVMKHLLREMDRDWREMGDMVHRVEVDHAASMARQRSEWKAYCEAMKEDFKKYVKQQVRKHDERNKQRSARRHEQILSAVSRITQPLPATANFYQYTFTAVDSDAQQWESPRFVVAGREYMLRLVRSGLGEEQTLRLDLLYWGRVYDAVKAYLVADDDEKDEAKAGSDEKDDEKKDEGNDLAEARRALAACGDLARGVARRRRVAEMAEMERQRARDVEGERERQREREREVERQRAREREQQDADRRRQRVQLQLELEIERARGARAREWDRQQSQRILQQHEELMAITAERERANRTQANREYARESFREFNTNSFAAVGSTFPHSDDAQPRRRRSVRFSLDNPFSSIAETGPVDRAEPADASTVAQSAAVQPSDADGTFDSFGMRTWQPAATVQPARVVVRFFVYDKPGRVVHYAPSSVSALPSVIYTSSTVLNVNVDMVAACASTTAVPLADSEGDGMRRGWMNSEWKSVSAAVMIDDTIDSQHNGLEYTAVDYLYATLRHRAHGVKQEGVGEASHSSGQLGVSGQLYMEDLTGEEEDDALEGMIAAAVNESNVPSLPVPMKRRRLDE